jgi:hypothetical protein
MPSWAIRPEKCAFQILFAVLFAVLAVAVDDPIVDPFQSDQSQTAFGSKELTFTRLTPFPPISPPKSGIAVVTICQKKTLSGESGNYMPEASLKQKRMYCAQNDYDFYGYTERNTSKVPGRNISHAAWFKLVVLRRHLDDYKWVLWIDCDTVFAKEGRGEQLYEKIENIIKRHKDEGVEMIAAREKFTHQEQTPWTDKYRKKIYNGTAANIPEGKEVYLRFVVNTGK